MNPIRSVSILSVLTVLSFFSTAYAEPKSLAQATTAAWLKRLDAGDYAGTWESAGSLFKAAVTLQVWQQQLQSTRDPLGAVQGREEIASTYTKTLPGVPDGAYVVMQYKTVFENKAEAVETLTATLEKDGNWRVVGYFVK